MNTHLASALPFACPPFSFANNSPSPEEVGSLLPHPV